MISLDCTMGLHCPDVDQGHMGVHTVLRAVERLKRIGAAGPETRFFVTHFSHNGGNLHAIWKNFLPRTASRSHMTDWRCSSERSPESGRQTADDSESAPTQAEAVRMVSDQRYGLQRRLLSAESFIRSR